MTRLIVRCIAVIVLVGAGVATGWQAAQLAGWSGLVDLPGLAPPRPHRFESHALRIEQVRQLGELVTLEVPVSDVQTSTLEGYTGGLSVVLLVRGSVLVSTNLDQARLEQVDPAGRTATLILPPPRTLRPRLDHERTQVYRSDRSGLWRWFPASGAESAAYDLAMRKAQGLLEEAARREELLARARQRTSDVLLPFFDALGWRVTLQWAEAVAMAPADGPVEGGGVAP